MPARSLAATPTRCSLRPGLAGFVSLALGLVIGLACAPPLPGGSCRGNPLCNTGELGAYCERDSECRQGHCCENDECDGGMCSLPCGKNDPCPGGLTCHDGNCHFLCDIDLDCADGQRCKDDSFCSWD